MIWGMARLARRIALLAAAVIAAIVVVRGAQAILDPDLAPWHRLVPAEAGAEEIDAMDWAGWLAREDAVFAEVRAMAEGLAPEYRTPENRYNPESPLYPEGFAVDWNRSFTLAPEGAPRGAVVLAHGLTDAPFSLRHVAKLYQEHGFYVVAPRMPGHGTTPGGLSASVWPQWMATVRMAAREARARAGDGVPLHVVGYSNGGALVTKYALEALRDPGLPKPDRVVLFSPMIGVTRFAAFAGLAGLPAVLPGFVRAAWLDLILEFNPFKYNSFPVQAAVQSHRLTRALQGDLEAARREGVIAGMPPVLAFQSAIDATVSAPALERELFGRLPANGSELVLVDVNRAAVLAPLFSTSADVAAARILPAPPRTWRASVIGAAGSGDAAAVADIVEAGETEATRQPLGVEYPRDIFSLSHVALPFPPDDGLYGYAPDPADDFGIRIGTLGGRGETGVVSVSAATFQRLYANPFYDQMAERIAAAIEADAGAKAPAGQ
ncbi:alpha/beta fold hydrolase [Amaricoccus sp.]|uniref:alpha/beta hydrolase n=1 Tax=Amaricoccus sp. TaxID=1872485 RepID=UPI001B677EC5|nr:alpha/beta fold hydrolase [Amaricoccus sp.]MBP7002211.1 alpha/beta hydrolase [Amaricoccus sp.]